ncbi:BaiN/RdsA family NAD(P)/FAD-dependent oxidoreductase [Algoriphagus hitonicola]|uniref:NAD(P)/FAD-dependent oxidoreductase n=1 Tax=Algoriphagus hitonicola TaxID=435880 RepID=UPI000B82D185|nr:NAD(P)/FAD-dependent oxidoreductase [Algoriphagus hitonicola]
MKIAVIGGGAAGFFAAIHAARQGNQVTIYEKTSKLLSKVRISGGGRCNVTHRPMEISKLVKNYPRGEKFLKRVFRHFDQKDTFTWFESRGVKLKVEEDGRVFPVSDDSSSIVDALLKEARERNVRIETGMALNAIQTNSNGLELQFEHEKIKVDAVILATGGNPKISGYHFLDGLNHQIKSPIPSLFTFNTPAEPIRKLMGLSVPQAHVRLESTKLSYSGPLLITHWGISGPAVLKLSAFGADWLHECKYEARAVINWNGNFKEIEYEEQLRNYQKAHPNRLIKNYPLFGIPGRLWEHFLERAEIGELDSFGNFSKKQLNKLVQNLFCYILTIKGKTTFKEEFVTAGGVDLSGIHPETMESIYHPNIYFSGEVLNIDGITGGFNFQAAWSTGYLAGVSSIRHSI